MKVDKKSKKQKKKPATLIARNEDLLDKYVVHGRRAASRIWGDTVTILILPWIASDWQNRFFELGPDETYIWKLLGKRVALKEVVSLFAKEKEIDNELAAQEVVRFVKELVAKKIVDVFDELAVA